MGTDVEAERLHGRGAALQEAVNKQVWMTLVAAMMVQLCTGNIYLFGTYSERLKEVLFSGDESAQRNLQTIALVGNFAGFMPLAGFFYDADVRIGGVRVVGGPRATTMFGVLLTFIGYYLIHRIAAGWDVGLAVACIFAAISNHGASYFNVTSVTLGVKNMPLHRGYAVGLLKSLLGLAGALITQVKFAFFDDDDGRGYVLFIAIFCSVLALLAQPFMMETEPLPVSHDAKRRFILSYSLVTTLALIMFAAGLSRAIVSGELPNWVEVVMLAVSVLMVVLICTSLLVPRVPAEETGYAEVVPEAAPPRRSQRHSMLSELHSTTGIDGMPPEEEGVLPETDRDQSPSQAIRTLDFWLLFFIFGVGTGGGLMMINNTAQIAKAKGGDSSEQAVASSLLYICNSLGRLTLSALGEIANARGIPRTMVLALTLVLHAGAHVLLSLPSLGTMYFGFCLAGYSYGGTQAVFPPVVSEQYGVRHFASNYMFLLLSPSIGVAIFSNVIGTAVFESHQERDDDADSSTYREFICLGNSCYFLTHIIIATCCLLAFFICLYAAHRTKMRRRLALALPAGTSHAEDLPLVDELPLADSGKGGTKSPGPEDPHPRA